MLSIRTPTIGFASEGLAAAVLGTHSAASTLGLARLALMLVGFARSLSAHTLSSSSATGLATLTPRLATTTTCEVT